ncbi:MAG: cupin domain-containing protein [Clostridia bacterium]|nr:cupin domain-containing protein [Clostridia bacterium]
MKYHQKLDHFPACIGECLPEAVSTISDNLQGNVLSGEKCQVVFWEVKEAFYVGEHSHSHAEWGIVVQGSCEVGIDGELKTYNAGEEFYIPPGIPHTSRMSANYRAVDFFSAGGWIQIKA